MHYDTPEKITALDNEARSWVGTPFWPNSAVKGERGGVSCHNLVAAILFATGLPSFPVPRGSAEWARANTESIIETGLDALPQFAHVNAPGEPVDMAAILPGDILGFRIGRCLHHVGIALPGGHFVHALRHAGAHISRLDDGAFLFDKGGTPRLLRVWRP